MLPDTHAKIARETPIIADDPAANPSIPSVKLAPFDTAVIMKMIIGINNNQPYFSAPSPAKESKLL